MPKDDAPGKRAIPKMASDARRIFVSSFLAFVPGVVFGIAGPVLAPDATEGSRAASGFFVVWFFFGLMYLYLTVRTFGGTNGETLAYWLRASTPRTRTSRFWLWFSGGSGISWGVQAAIFAVIIVLLLSFSPESRSDPVALITGIGAVVGSWLLIVASFASHYARTNEYGLRFSGDREPIFTDYVYLAVQVSTGYSAADVTTVTPAMRRTVTIHSVIAFAFNTVIIAILVAALISTAS